MSVSDMHRIDAVILGVTGLAFLVGAVGGFVRQVVRLATVAAAGYAATRFHGFAGDRLSEWAGGRVPEVVAAGVTFVVLVTGLSVAVALARWGLGLVTPARIKEPLARLKWLNAVLGGAVAGLLAYLAVGAVLFGLELLPLDETKGLTDGSRLGRPCRDAAAAVLTAIPQPDTSWLDPPAVQ